MQERDVQGILEKVEELKTVFSFGVKFLPFLEDLLVFVQEMAPMLNEMNQSIQDSSSKMPKAVQQLDKVTSATELATNEILDKVDSMLGRLEQVNTNFNIFRERLSAEQTALTGIAGAIEELLALPGVRETLNRMFEDEKARQKGIEIKTIVDDFLAGKIGDDLSQNVDSLLQDIQTDAYDIMNALQVQDITTQQIEGAHSMLRSIQERLNHLITQYSEATPPAISREARAHDSQAVYDMDGDRQKAVDEMLNLDPDLIMQQAETSAVEESASVEEQEEQHELPSSSAFDESSPEAPESDGKEPDPAEIDELLSWGDDLPASALPGDEPVQMDGEMTEASLPVEESIPADESSAIEDLSLDEMIPQDSVDDDKPVEEQPAVSEKSSNGKGSKAGKSAGKPAESEPGASDNIKISQEEIDKLFQ
jgi:hypothetical protein